MITYELIRRDIREEDCAGCKNRLPEKNCAIELAVVNGMTVFDSQIEYGLECWEWEGIESPRFSVQTESR